MNLISKESRKKISITTLCVINNLRDVKTTFRMKRKKVKIISIISKRNVIKTLKRPQDFMPRKSRVSLKKVKKSVSYFKRPLKQSNTTRSNQWNTRLNSRNAERRTNVKVKTQSQ